MSSSVRTDCIEVLICWSSPPCSEPHIFSSGNASTRDVTARAGSDRVQPWVTLLKEHRGDKRLVHNFRQRPTHPTICSTGPVTRELKIDRYRGIRSLAWSTAGGEFDCGGGVVGKLSILDAIALFLSPADSATVSDTDYYLRDVPAEFSIEAISLPATQRIDKQVKPS